MTRFAVALSLGYALSLAAGPTASVAFGTVGLLPNPSFELVEPPLPTAGVAAAGGQAPADTWLPRTWAVWAPDGALWRCPDDPALAHSGRRCASFVARQGSGNLRYGPLPAAQPGPWSVQVWARGSGQLVVGAYDVLPERWTRIPQEQVFSLSGVWTPCVATVQLPATSRQWLLELCTRGPTDVWLDDVLLSCPGVEPVPLPPAAALAKDADTLLYLPFETALDEDAFYLGGAVRLTAAAAGPEPSDRPGEGRFGRALALGVEGYVACSATENLDPAQGTIEFWVRLLSPGNDRVYRPLLSVPGPEGMDLCKDQYSHISFSFCSGWRALAHAWSDGYAYAWQPGVWRHLAACWDKDLMQLFVDGKLIASVRTPKLPRALGPELRIGSPDVEIDDLRISRTVRYRMALPPLSLQ